ncbi:MAG TPA: hypothetical protein VK638_44215 [Edaphobacter sp.]|nr:hypothetical protein [Edaphobacter sp.]
MQVSVVYARDHLPNLIRLAEGGEEITIERHGRPVAQLRPLPPELRPKQDDSLDDAFNELLCPAYLKDILHS